MNIQTIYNAALLAHATYKDGLISGRSGASLQSDLTDFNLETDEDGVADGTTSTQAKAVADRYSVVYQQATTASGFSATLFRANNGSGYTLAIRGTDGAVDWRDANLDIGLFGAARNQIIDMINFWLRLTSSTPMAPQYHWDFLNNQLSSDYELAPAIGAINGNTRLTITGHSLGGHLASAFRLLLPDVVSQVYTFNSAGFIGWAGEEFTSLARQLYGTVLGRSPDEYSPLAGPMFNITDITAPEDEVSDIWGGSHLGRGVEVIVESVDGEGAIDVIVENHSVDRLVDALAAADFMARLDSTMTIARANDIFSAASSTMEDSLEKLMERFSELFAGPSIATDDYNETVYDAIHTILDGLQEDSTYSIKLVSQDTLQAAADGDLAASYALMNLSPVVVSGDASLYQQHNANGELEYDRYSADFWYDKARMLDRLMDRNRQDLAEDVQGIDDDSRRYRDLELGVEFRTNDHGTSEPHAEIVFGSRSGEPIRMSSGAIRPDHLYGLGGDDFLDGGHGDDLLDGGDGSDTLQGGKGSDLLIGGRGQDTYRINSGDGNDTIIDDGGVLIINGQTIAEVKEALGDGGFYLDSQDNRYVEHGEGFDIQINGGGTVKVRGSAGQPAPTLAEFIGTVTQLPDTFGNQNNPFVFSSEYQRTPDEKSSYTPSGLAFSRARGAEERGDEARDAQRAINEREIYFNATTGLPSGGSFHGQVGGYMEGAGQFDVLLGNSNQNALAGLGDNDWIDGRAGSDWLEGGAGSDTIKGGGGSDIIWGDAQSDDIRLTESSDYDGFYDTNLLDEAGDRNILSGDAGEDKVSGGRYVDVIDGGTDLDYLFGGSGDDIIYGGAGDTTDVIFGDSSFHYRVEFSDPMNFASGTEIYEIKYIGSPEGGASNNDTINGGGGGDLIYGELGNDSLYGDEGDDVIHGDRATDEGNYELAYEALQGTSFTLGTPLHGNDMLYGGAGNDYLLGDGGDDILDGGQGNDTLDGGAGNDNYVFRFGDGGDKISDAAGNSTLLFSKVALHEMLLAWRPNSATLNYRPGSSVAWDQVTATPSLFRNFNLATNSVDERFSVRQIDQHFYDGAGNLVAFIAGSLSPASGAEGSGSTTSLNAEMSQQGRLVISGGGETDAVDVFYQGGVASFSSGDSISQGLPSIDVLQAVLPNTQFVFSANAVVKHFDNGVNTSLQGTAYRDDMYGYDGMDRLIGRAGDDVLYGGDGGDVLEGGDGKDILIGGRGNDALSMGGDSGNVLHFSAGDGNDTLDGGGSGAIYFDNSVARENIVFEYRSAFGATNWEHTFNIRYGENDSIRVSNVRERDLAVYWNGERVEWLVKSTLANGGFWDLRGDNTFVGGKGADTFYMGSEAHSWDPIGWGDDTLLFSAGDGNDIIYVGDPEGYRHGEIVFDHTVLPEMLSFSFAQGSAVIHYGAGDSIRFIVDPNYATSDINPMDYFTVRFEAVPGHEQPLKIAGTLTGGRIEGSFGNDLIVGTAASEYIRPGSGDNVVLAGGGNDEIDMTRYLRRLQGSNIISGGRGTDEIRVTPYQGNEYRFSVGHGEDLIQLLLNFNHAAGSGRTGDSDYYDDFTYSTLANGGPGIPIAFNPRGEDVIRFGSGLSIDDLSFRRDGDDLGITYRPSPGEGIYIENFFFAFDKARYANAAPRSSSHYQNYRGLHPEDAYVRSLLPASPISYLYFDDGSVFDMNVDLARYLPVELAGGAGADVLVGGPGDDTVNGAAGNDVLTGGAGDDWLNGGAGSDSYRFDGRFGDDVIVDEGGGPGDSDRIVFGAEVEEAAVFGVRLGDSLVLHHGTNSVEIQEFFAGSSVNRVQFASGVEWDRTRMAASVEVLDERGHLVRTSDVDGQSFYAYDVENRLIFSVDPAGVVRETRYDGSGRVTDVITYADNMAGFLYGWEQAHQAERAPSAEAIQGLFAKANQAYGQYFRQLLVNGEAQYTLAGEHWQGQGWSSQQALGDARLTGVIAAASLESAAVQQRIELSGFDAAMIDAGQLQLGISGRDWSPANVQSRWIATFSDDNGDALGAPQITTFAAADGWSQRDFTLDVPAGARAVQLSLTALVAQPSKGDREPVSADTPVYFDSLAVEAHPIGAVGELAVEPEYAEHTYYRYAVEAVEDNARVYRFDELVGSDNQTLTIESVGNAINGSVSINTVSQTITFMPADGFIGQGGFDYQLNDGNSLRSLSVAVGVVPSVYRGTEASDLWQGTAAADDIYGGGGNDFLHGAAKGDVIYGEAGDDQLWGDAGNDILIGQAGNDQLFGGTENDVLFGDAGDDTLLGDSGNDSLYGLEGADVLFGGSGADFLLGGTGADELQGGEGSDTYYFYRGDGVDVIYNHSNNAASTLDKLQFGFGIAPADIQLSRGSSWGLGADDLIIEILGTGDRITVSGFFLAGGSAVLDQIRFTGNATVWNEPTIRAAVQWIGDSGNNTLTDAVGGQRLLGLAGNDVLLANAGGNDYLDGGSGDDQLAGGQGSDIYVYGQTNGDGHDLIDNYSSTWVDDVDQLSLYQSSPDSLWFSQAGDDLRIEFIGSDGSVTVQDWFAQPSGEHHRIDQITADNGNVVLYANRVQQLVDAMASFTDTSGIVGINGQAPMDDPQLNAALAATWSSAA